MKRAKQNGLQRKRNVHCVGDGLGMRHVYLDGEIQEHCICANVRRGFIIRHKKGRDGHLIVDFATESLVTEKVRGKVRVKFI
ncbi:hypothetical protein LVJ82_16995 [Vitreoscilla massiliensis]|uniref:Uncharacterized protein n=1 Tax=Vitreoscilla massiliensis TaxID=1689272 RepID=A0ABY4E063_9NEIS|nr:hypothetical protein [Vitreoscilla massiliensis]UOO89116.1 hypothetical protein LVJ82_16995 [Vitreoscilla massiliensis]